jgi:hypothetical protein
MIMIVIIVGVRANTQFNIKHNRTLQLSIQEILLWILHRKLRNGLQQEKTIIQRE